jgi:hypothetical protein
LTVSLTSRAAGRTTPAPPVSPVTDPASGRPPELDDPEWLARKLATDGTMAIALELGVSRKVVRTRCEQFGLRPADHGNGRRRGVPLPAPRLTTDSSTLDLIRDRLERDLRRRVPATEGLFVQRLQAVQDARTNGDHLAEEDAWIGVAAAAGLVHQHKRKLRRTT